MCVRVYLHMCRMSTYFCVLLVPHIQTWVILETGRPYFASKQTYLVLICERVRWLSRTIGMCIKDDPDMLSPNGDFQTWDSESPARKEWRVTFPLVILFTLNLHLLCTHNALLWYIFHPLVISLTQRIMSTAAASQMNLHTFLE